MNGRRASATPWASRQSEITPHAAASAPPLFEVTDSAHSAADQQHTWLPMQQLQAPGPAPMLPAPKPYSSSIQGLGFHIEADGRPAYGSSPHASYYDSSSRHDSATAAAAAAGAAAGGGRLPSHSSASSLKQQHAESALGAWLVPDRRTRFWALWTSLFTLLACFAFAYMAGDYGLYLLSPTYRQFHGSSSSGGGNSTSAMVPLTDTWGPRGLGAWLKFWAPSQAASFDVPFLLAWGARYAPAIRAGQWWRLFSSLLIHGSFVHLLTNLLTFVVLAVPLEHSYGPLRIAAIFLASGFGGTFLSMAFEDGCAVYVGASGAVFGFLGLYLADIVLNFESLYRPLLRLGLMLACLGLTLGVEFGAAARAQAATGQRVSHLSHVGGLVVGLVVSFMFLPNLRDRRWRAARKVARRIGHTLHDRLSFPGGAGSGGGGGSPRASVLERMQSCWQRHAWLYWTVWALSFIAVLFFLGGLPAYIWLYRLPSVACEPLVNG